MKTGADDFIAAHGADAFRSILDAALPAKEALAIFRSQPAFEAATDFLDFDPIDAAPARPPFPVSALSPWLGEHVAAVAASTRFPLDMAAGFAMGAVAAAARGAVEVRVNETWREPCVLYIAIVADPSEGKSPVFKQMMAPIFKRNIELSIEHKPRVAAERALRVVDEKRLNRKQSDLERCSADVEAELTREVRELAAKLDAPLPAVPRLAVQDVTPEALAPIMEQQRERMAVLTPEDTLFGHLGGRYNEKSPAIEIFLSSYVGEPVIVDRASRQVNLKSPLLNICAAMQPAVLDGKGSRLADSRGLLARILYFVPQRTVGTRDLSTDPPPLPVRISTTYEHHIVGISEIGLGTKEPIVMYLTDGARRSFRAWQCALERRRADDGDLAVIRGWAGKAEGFALRIAGLLVLADGMGGPLRTSITEDVLIRAFAIVEYLSVHARIGIGLAVADETIVRAARLLDWIRRTKLSGVSPGDVTHPKGCFTEAEAQKANRTWMTKAQASETCRILHQPGYIRRDTTPTKGRPAVRWEAHVERVSGVFGVSPETRNEPLPSLIPSLSIPVTDQHPKAPERVDASVTDYSDEWGAP